MKKNILKYIFLLFVILNSSCSFLKKINKLSLLKNSKLTNSKLFYFSRQKHPRKKNKENNQLKNELLKLELEQKKIELETQKFKLNKEKNKTTFSEEVVGCGIFMAIISSPFVIYNWISEALFNG